MFLKSSSSEHRRDDIWLKSQSPSRYLPFKTCHISWYFVTKSLNNSESQLLLGLHYKRNSASHCRQNSVVICFCLSYLRMWAQLFIAPIDVSTTPIMAMGCCHCLPPSVVQLKGKHCQKTHCRNGVVGMFEHTQYTWFLPHMPRRKTMYHST